MKSKKLTLICSIGLILVLLASLVLAACAKEEAPAAPATPAPAKPAPATPAPAKPAPATPAPAKPAPATPAPTPTPTTPAIQPPKEIIVSGGPATSATQMVLLAVAPEYEKLMGTSIRIVPTELLQSQALLMRIGRADLWNVHLGSAYRAIFGTEEYCTPEWGPQPIRIVWKGSTNCLSLMTQANSGIKTMADLKGRKVAVYTGGGNYVAACLAFGGLTLDDVQVVPEAGYTGSLNSVLEGRTDAGFIGTTSAGTYEIAQSPAGLYAIPIPHSDTQGWARLQKIYPVLIPATVRESVGPEEVWGVEMLGFARGLYAYGTANPGATYATARAWTEGYDAYKDKHSELIENTLENALDIWSVPVPYHEGSIAYFKEIGVWTSGHDVWQRMQLEREQARQDAWGKAMLEAETRGINMVTSNTEWQALWQSYLNKID